jgi:DNA-binding PadR family transcriptional regulator
MPRHHHGNQPFGPWGREMPFRRRRMRRGDVRAALLVLLAEEPRNGYGLMQEIEERSEGEWRPSPGSVYPALSQLEDEGLVAPEGEGNGRQFGLTEAGRAHVDEHREELGEPWANLGEGGPNRDLRRAVGELAGAAMQVARAGDQAQGERALAVLVDARKAMYRILAED